MKKPVPWFPNRSQRSTSSPHCDRTSGRGRPASAPDACHLTTASAAHARRRRDATVAALAGGTTIPLCSERSPAILLLIRPSKPNLKPSSTLLHPISGQGIRSHPIGAHLMHEVNGAGGQDSCPDTNRNPGARRTAPHCKSHRSTSISRLGQNGGLQVDRLTFQNTIKPSRQRRCRPQERLRPGVRSQRGVGSQRLVGSHHEAGWLFSEGLRQPWR